LAESPAVEGKTRFHLTLSRKGLIFVALPLAFQSFLVIAFHAVKNRYDDDNRWQLHSHEVAAEASNLLRLLLDEEAALRGFVLTGDPSLAKPYHKAVAEIPAALVGMQALVQDHAGQRASAARLATLARQRLDHSQHVLGLMERGATEEAVRALTSATAVQEMDDFRAEMDRFTTQESRLASARRDAADTSGERLNRFVVIASCLTLLAALAPLLLTMRIARRIETLADNVRRFGAGQPLRPAGRGTDEIADLDRALHRLADDLARAERRFTTVLDSMGEGLYQIDRQGRLVYMNPAAENLLGYRLDEIRGKPMHDVIHFRAPDGTERPAAECPLVAVIRDGVVYKTSEDHFVRSDGTFLTVAYTSAPILEEGRTTGAVLTFQDSSERKRAEGVLRESEASFRAVIDNQLGGLIVVEPSGFIEMVNPAAERIFGYTKDELVGQHLALLVPPQAGPDPRVFLKAAAGRALGNITEWEGRRKDGEVFPFELSMFEFTTNTGRHLAGSVRDISERKEVERLKKEFLSTVSHELRTPLTSLRGSLGLLAGGALGDLSDEAREVVEIAERNCARLIGLVNDILDLERLEAGRLELRIEEGPLDPILQRSVESVSGMAATHGVSLQASPTTARVRGDADRLGQVVINLLSNAVKFSPRDSVVTVSARAEGPWAEVRVADRGRGIPAALRGAIFERFKQVEASDARQKGGTGLGLAICKAIVEQHGGQIGVESEEGKGSTFWFRVPAVGAPSAEALSARDVPVVLLESRPESRAALTMLLGDRGHPVEATDSLAQAAALLGQRPASLLLLGTPPAGLSLRQCRESLRSALGLEPLPLSVLGDLAHPDLPETLIVYFARRAADPFVTALRAAADEGGDGGDVLLVDDDEPLLGVLARQLLQRGISVRVATTGREAVRQCLLKPPLLLVLDLGLPDGEGADVVKQMRQEPRLAGLPLLVYTGRDLGREQEEELRLGPTRFLTKSRATDDQFLALVSDLMAAPARSGSPA
jgi:PAS domain S-box-containing protein